MDVIHGTESPVPPPAGAGTGQLLDASPVP